MGLRLRFVFLGLSITSSWGNGHATTYRGLLRALAKRDHEVVFLERDVPWYREHRDLPEPAFAKTHLYRDVAQLQERFGAVVRDADVVVLGSFVPDGRAVADWVLQVARGAVLFYDIDTPVTVAALERDECAYLSRAQVPRFAAYLSFTGGPLLSRLEEDFGAERAVPLYCSVDPADYPPAPERDEHYDLGYLGTYSADRQPGLDRFLVKAAVSRNARRFVVAGPQYPPHVRWPPNVERVDHVPPRDHPAFYHSQRFTLNVTRAQMVQTGFAPSVRLFEAAATATPVLTDVWPGLDQFFELGREILPVWGTRDVLRALDMVPDEERMRMGRRARARVLAAHTPAHRAAVLEALAAEVLERGLAHA